MKLNGSSYQIHETVGLGRVAYWQLKILCQLRKQLYSNSNKWSPRNLLSNFMISLFVPGQSFVRVKDHVTGLTLIREGIGIVNTFNVIPGISSLVPRVLITNGTHES